MNTEHESLANKLRNLRTNYTGLTQRQLALLSEVPEKTINEAESGRTNPGIENLAKLSKFFGIPLEQDPEIKVKHRRCFSADVSDAVKNRVLELRANGFSLRHTQKITDLPYRWIQRICHTEPKFVGEVRDALLRRIIQDRRDGFSWNQIAHHMQLFEGPSKKTCMTWYKEWKKGGVADAGNDS